MVRGSKIGDKLKPFEDTHFPSNDQNVEGLVRFQHPLDRQVWEGWILLSILSIPHP